MIPPLWKDLVNGTLEFYRDLLDSVHAIADTLATIDATLADSQKSQSVNEYSDAALAQLDTSDHMVAISRHLTALQDGATDATVYTRVIKNDHDHCELQVVGFPGCIIFASSYDDALAAVPRAVQLYIAAMRSDGPRDGDIPVTLGRMQ